MKIIDLQLEINQVPISIKTPFSSTLRRTHGFREPGYLILRYLTKKISFPPLFWIKNCDVSFFNSRFTIPFSTHIYSILDLYFGSCNAYFLIVDDLVESVKIWVKRDVTETKNLAIEFEQIASEFYGDPKISGLKCSWSDDNSLFTSYLSPDGKIFSVEWTSMDWLIKAVRRVYQNSEGETNEE